MLVSPAAVAPLLEPDPKDTVQRVALSCQDVSHSVRVRTGCCKSEERRILHDVNATFPPGSLTALMGPSGAGKTTLLSLLRSGRPSSGEIKLNGKRHAGSRGLIRTIPQDDVLLAGLTAAEALMYCAQLCLPRASCERRVAEVLNELSLGPELAHTKIGSVESRGLSGGQRKRVSIGMELLADPAVLLVDEPTSGLDAKMAHGVMTMLKSLAEAGRTIVSTVHQPSYKIFALFDQLVILSDGRLAYAGEAGAASAYFAAAGFATPMHENPAEFILGVLGDPAAGGASLTELWAARSAPALATPGGGGGGAVPPAGGGGGARASAPFVPSSCAQWWVLLRRELYDQVKDTRKLAATVGMRVVVGLIVGVLFNGQGRRDEYSAIFPVTSSMFIALFNSNLDTTMDTLLKAPAARALLRREWLNGLYSCEAYFFALIVSSFLMAALNTLGLVLPLYWLVGFSATLEKAAVFFAALLLMTVIGMCMGTAIGCASSGMAEARKMLMPMIAPQMIFSGYVLPYQSLPVYFRWCYYASFWQYSLAILRINEFAGRVYTEGCPTELVESMAYHDIQVWLEEHDNVTLPDRQFHGNCSGTISLESEGLWPPKFGGLQGYFLVLGGYALGFVLIAYLALKLSLRKAAGS